MSRKRLLTPFTTQLRNDIQILGKPGSESQMKSCCCEPWDASLVDEAVSLWNLAS